MAIWLGMEIEQPAQVTPQVVDAPAAPVEAAPVVAPVETPAAPADAPAVETPAVEPVAPADAPIDAPATESENILGDPDKKEEAKPDAKPEGDKPADAPAETPVETVLPTYEDFKLPENYTADKESLSEFTKLLGEMETSAGKLDHAGYQDAGQKLIDLGTKAVQDSITRLNEYYTQFHENQKKEWFESFKKDPEMGGEKLQETVSVLRSSVEQYGGTPEQVAEFRQIMKDTGVGNHPAVTRILFNMQQKINKYETEADNGNGGSNRIVPGAKPAPTKVKSYQQFYGGSNNS